MRRCAIFGRSAAWYKHAQVFGQVVGGKFEEEIGNRIRASFASGWGQNFTINMCWQIAMLFFRLHCLVRFHCLWSRHKSKESMLCSAGCSMQSLVGWLWTAMRGGMSCAKCTSSWRQLRKFARLAPGRIFFQTAISVRGTNCWFQQQARICCLLGSLWTLVQTFYFNAFSRPQASRTNMGRYVAQILWTHFWSVALVSSCSWTCEVVSLGNTICTILPKTIFAVAYKSGSCPDRTVVIDSDARRKKMPEKVPGKDLVSTWPTAQCMARPLASGHLFETCWAHAFD